MIDIEEALARLGEGLSVHASDVWRSLRPPVADADLDALRQAVKPYDVPTDVVALLRWADGQERGAPWFPGFEAGRLLSASAAAGHYKWLAERLTLDLCSDRGGASAHCCRDWHRTRPSCEPSD
jgi:hypothetical protein